MNAQQKSVKSALRKIERSKLILVKQKDKLTDVAEDLLNLIDVLDYSIDLIDEGRTKIEEGLKQLNGITNK